MPMMERRTRLLLIVCCGVVIVVMLLITAIPAFLNTSSFRARIESDLSQALGRKVTFARLHISIWSGGLVADNAAVADDPSFSTVPFLQAEEVKIRVELLPLLFHHQIRVHGFKLESPRVQLIRGANGKWNYATLGRPANGAPPAQPSALPDLTADTIDVSNGQIMVQEPGSPARNYTQVGLAIQHFSFIQAFPFTASATLPGNGSLQVNGSAGPMRPGTMDATPFTAQITLKHAVLGQTGLLPPSAGIDGTADLQARIQANGQTLTATGSAQVQSIRLARNGSPSATPLQARFAITEDTQNQTGQIEPTTVSVGGATVHLDGSFQSKSSTTNLDLQANGNGMPIDSLEAFLPALGVRLPQGSQLRGGTLTTSLHVTGASASPAVSGPVRVQNTQLAGFDLGSQLQALSQITGGRAGGATRGGTTIRSLSLNIEEQAGNVRAQNIDLDVANLGTATGSGAVSAGGAVNFSMVLKLGSGAPTRTSTQTSGQTGGIAGGLAGLLGGSQGGAVGGLLGGVLANGVPVHIGGTTSHPTFAPNLRGVGTGAAKSLVGGQGKKANGNQLKNALGGFLGKH